ncbi:MAG TPA: hypothetical protein VFI79_03115 [Gemmatimonadales bacterium]|nr:hypothetical protein [Gemmatimonadales bacterium]
MSINRPGVGYRLRATANGLTAALSGVFNVVAGPAKSLTFTVQPAATNGGSLLSPAVQVTAFDAQGNVADGYSGAVTIGITPGTGSGTAVLSGTTTVNAVAGVATFATLRIDKAATGYTLTASASGITPATSGSLTINIGPATGLGFTTPPTNAVAGTQIGAIQVSAVDSGGNVVTSYSGDVSLAIGTNAGGGTLSGSTTATAVSGVATFSTLRIDKAGIGYTLAATGTGLAGGGTSPAFNIDAGPAVALAVTVQPSDVSAGTVMSPPVQVTARDSLGNTATSFSGDVTIAIGIDSAGGTLSGTKTVAAVGGIATFNNAMIDKVGTGYTLVVSSPGLPSVSTVAFAVAPGAPTQLAVTIEPTSATGGAILAPAIQVIAQDALGNTATAYTGGVTAAIGSNPGAGTLSGTKTVAAVAGVATFSALSIDKAASGYTLSFTAPGLTAATSAPFDVAVGQASQLAFTIQPGTTPAGAMVTPAVKVTALDPGGNTVTAYASDVTVALGANPASGTLSGTTTVTAAGGVATFSTLNINRSGVGYTLTATATGLTEATSVTFSITPGPATQLAVTIQPTGAMGGAIITPAVQVTAQDALGNTATAFTGNVTATIGTNLAGGTLSGTTTVPAIAGVASFSTLSIDRAGNGYALAFAATGLTGATSAPFDVLVGQASRLAFTFPPGTTTAGATITPAVTVTALDAGGNTVTGFTANVTVALGTNPGNGTLSGTSIVAAVGGVATFSTLSIDKSGAGYTLTATTAGVTAATSPPFTINAGTASKLAVTVQPTNTTDGATITPAVQLTAQDALGNTATGFSGDVTLGIQTNPGSGSLSGTTTRSAVAGVVAFADLSIDKTGAGYTLVATSPGLTEAVSAPFAITPGAATQLVFSVQPAATAAGTAMSPAIQVSALTALGNLATGFTGNVTMTIGANVSGGTLTGTTTIAATAGVATFATLSIDKAGTGYTLLASASGVTTATSAPFSITAGLASQLAFSVQPTTTVAGVIITPAVKVTARDALGNTATGFTGNVTVAISANPGGGSLSGTSTVAAVSGVATFSNLSINRSGAGYALSAVATGVTGATSGSFTIIPGAATQLAFSVQPGNTTAGAAITPAVQVTALDALGNTATGFTGSVAIAIAANPAGGTLSGTQTIAAVAGVATFADLSIDKSGLGYTLSATATSLTAATSAAFAIAPGPASQLVITIQPSNTTGGAVITPAVRVTARDSLGNTATGFSGEVTAAIQTNPGGGTLSGTSVVAAVAGIANFSTLSIDKAGSGYTLAVSSAGLTGATSAPFDVAVGAASRLGFTVSPATTTAGTTIAPAMIVSALDPGGNAVTSFTGNVAVAITPGTGTAGAALSGTTTVAAVSGAATFSTLSINKSGSGYTLSASSSGLTGATSAPFAINPGPATQLAITVQPTNTTAGAVITPAVQVTARDALGNTATGFAGDVTMTIQANPGSGTLSGTTTVTAAAGVASFPTLSIDKAGSGYTLAASASGLTGATSNVFSILVGAASRLSFTVQPATTAAGATITPAVQAAATDAGGNPVTSFTGTVTLAITAGTGTAGATLLGTTSVSAVGGVATFSTLKINTTGSGYTLTATASALTSAVSAAFDIVTGPATQLKFTVQPTQTNAGATMTPAVEVTAQDAVGNTVTTFAGNVALAIGTNPGGGTLSGTTTEAAVNGVAVFSTLSIDKSAAGYTLVASSAGLATATSASFTIKTGAATQLVFTAQPTITSAGATITPAVQVTARDGLGNTATAFTGTITVAIGANPGGGTLSGTTSVTAVAGVATFADLSIDQAGSGYTLTANASGLPGATSALFDVSSTSLVFTTQPTTTTAGAKITPAVQVTARDALGHTITTFTGKVTVAILSGTGAPGATLSGTTTVSAVAGVASFSTLSIDKAASGYRLTASASGFPPGVSSSFTINAGTATKLGFIVQPSTTPAGATIIPAVQVAAQDALGNTVKSFTGTVTMTISTNPGSGTLSGTTTVLLNAGVAAFSTLSINKAGVGYKLRATVTGLTNATSTAFDITPAAATLLFYEQQPSTATAGDIIAPPVVITAHDSMGNTVTSFTGDITVLITAGSGTSGATLFGTTTVSAVAGVATFSDLRIDKAGTGYKLSATASGVAGKNSASFQIIAGTAAKVSFSVQPANATAGAIITPAVEVTVRDSLNNVVKTFTDSITVSIATNPSGGTLSGTTTVAATAGVAVFADLSINLAGTGYRLAAAATGLASAMSNSFTISP